MISFLKLKHFLGIGVTITLFYQNNYLSFFAILPILFLYSEIFVSTQRVSIKLILFLYTTGFLMRILFFLVPINFQNPAINFVPTILIIVTIFLSFLFKKHIIESLKVTKKSN